MKKKIIRNTVITVLMILLTVVYTWLAKNKGEYFFSFYNGISQKTINMLAQATSFFSFSLWEILAAVIVTIFIINLISSIRKKRFILWCSRVILTICVLIHLFVSIWGLNYYQPQLFERMNLNNRAFSKEELEQATTYFLQQAVYYESRIERNENGEISKDYDQINDEIFKGYEVLSNQYDFIDCVNVNAKKLLSSRYFALSSTTGIFVCLTGESNVSRYCHYTSLPFTIAHEMAHRSCIAREDEANFIAYLVCTDTDDDWLNYSANYEAFIYCFNALYETDKEATERVKNRISEGLRNDIIKAEEHYDKLENKKVNDLSNDFYDQYLSSFDIEGGVRTYSEVVQLLLCWYCQK